MTTPADELARHAAEYLSWERTYTGAMTAEHTRQLTRECLAEDAGKLGIPRDQIETVIDQAIADASKEPAAS